MKKICVITIMNSITETSMPYNEFVLGLYDHYPHIKQYIFILDNKISKQIRIEKEIEICGLKKFSAIRNRYKKIVKENELNGYKIIVHLHHPKSAFIFNFITLFIKKYQIFNVHSTFSQYSIKNKILSSLAQLKANKIICVSETAYNSIPIFIKKMKKNNVFSIQNGVDTERIDKKKNLEKNVDEEKIIKLIYVARFIPIKNQRFILEVIKYLDGVKLYLIGKEDENKEIRKLAKANNVIEKVSFMGQIERDKVFELLKKSNIYLSPSLVEGLPVSVLEAMYCGLPVILSNIPQHLEIQKKVKSVTCLPLEVDIWISKIKEMQSNDQLDKIGEENKRGVEMFFSLKEMLKKYVDIYNDIVVSL